MYHILQFPTPGIVRLYLYYVIFGSNWASDSSTTSIVLKQFFSGEKNQFALWRYYDYICFILDQHTKLDFYGASSLKQQYFNETCYLNTEPKNLCSLIPENWELGEVTNTINSYNLLCEPTGDYTRGYFFEWGVVERGSLSTCSITAWFYIVSRLVTIVISFWFIYFLFINQTLLFLFYRVLWCIEIEWMRN